MKDFFVSVLAVLLSLTSLHVYGGRSPDIGITQSSSTNSSSETLITLTRVTLVEDDISLIIKDPTEKVVIEDLVSTLNLSDYSGGPQTGGSVIKVLIVEDDATTEYAFLSGGLVRIYSNPDAWYESKEDAFDTLNNFFGVKKQFK